MEKVTIMKDDVKVSMVIIFVITILVLSIIPLTVNSETFENSYGKLDVYPDISRNIIRQKQFFNATSYLPSQELDIAFRFNDSLSYGGVYYWNNNQYNKLDVEHIEHNNKHWYLLNDIYFEQDETKQGFWEYDIPINTSGKWDMFIKRSSDTLQYALDNNLYVHLDPYWNSSYLFANISYVCNAIEDYSVMYNLTYDSKMNANFSDVRWIGNTSGANQELYFWIEEKVNSSYCLYWVNISSYEWVGYYFNNSGVGFSDYLNGSNTFLFFDDFNDGVVDSQKWENDVGTTTEGSGYITVNDGSGEAFITVNSYQENLRFKSNSKFTQADTFFGLTETNPADYDRRIGFGSTVLNDFDALQTLVEDENDGGGQDVDNHAVTPDFNSKFIDMEFLWLSDTSVKWYYEDMSILRTEIDANQILNGDNVYIIFFTWSGDGIILCDWVFLSKYSLVESTFCNWSGELEPPSCNCTIFNPDPSNNTLNFDFYNISKQNFSVNVSTNGLCSIIDFVNISMSNGSTTVYHNVTSVSNGSFYLNWTGLLNFSYSTQYNWSVVTSCDDSINSTLFFFTTVASDIDAKIDYLIWINNLEYNKIIGVDDEVDINLGLDGTILTLALFGIFFIVGYVINKRSGGVLMLFSGFTLSAFEFLASSVLNAVLVIPLLSPIAILIIVLGVRKWLYPVENENTKSEGT